MKLQTPNYHPQPLPRNPRNTSAPPFALRHSSLLRISNFVIRISHPPSLHLPPHQSPVRHKLTLRHSATYSFLTMEILPLFSNTANLTSAAHMHPSARSAASNSCIVICIFLTARRSMCPL